MTSEWNPIGFDLSHFHLEISSKCALKCPRCPRTEHPETPWLNKQLSLSDIKTLIPDEIISQHIQRITICGDVGDPIYNSEFHEIIEHFKKTNPAIHLYIITNGSHKSKAWWEKTASLLNERDTIAFSVDGFDQESNETYRIGSNWKSILVGMQEIAKSRAFMVWALIAFKFNENEIENIKNMAKEVGCDYFQITKSTKFGSHYQRFNTSENVDPLQPSSKWISKTLRFERESFQLSNRSIDNSDFIGSMTQKTKKVEQEFKDSTVFPLCKNGNRGLYINVTGQLYPCSWVSFPYTRTTSLKTKRTVYFKDSFFIKYAQELNILKNGFYQTLSNPLWNKIYESFKSEQTCFIECEHKCRKEVMSLDYQIGWFLN